MTDPTMARMSIGFAVFAIAVFVWASIDYNRFIKFWMLRPAPYTLPHTGSKRVKTHEETDCSAGNRLAHLCSLCDLCRVSPWFLCTNVFRRRLGCRVLVG